MLWRSCPGTPEPPGRPCGVPQNRRLLGKNRPGRPAQRSLTRVHPRRVRRGPGILGAVNRGVVVALLVLVVTLGAVATARAADVYEGRMKIGSVQRMTATRYKVIAGYSRLGYVTRTSPRSTRWSVYKGRSRIGYVKPTSRNRWDIFSRRSVNEGYVTRAGPPRAPSSSSCSPEARSPPERALGRPHPAKPARPLLVGVARGLRTRDPPVGGSRWREGDGLLVVGEALFSRRRRSASSSLS